MADPKSKEGNTEIKRNAEALKQLQDDIYEKLERMELANATRFERMETTAESKFEQIHTALDILIQQTPSKASHGVGLGNKQPFQGANFVFVDIEKTTWKPGGMYFMTFQAQQDPSNTNITVTTFQAQVKASKPGPLHVYSCAIKSKT